MEDRVQQKKRWFLKIELAVLICVICIWIVKALTVDLDSTKAAVLSQVVKISPNNDEAQNLLGNAYFDLADYEKAVKAYETAIKTNPDNADTYRHLADCYCLLDRDEDEIEAHKQVVRIDPGYAKAYSLLAGCYIEGERCEEAADILRQLVKIEPKDAYRLLIVLGIHYCESGHYEEAVEAYKQAIEIDPNMGPAHDFLAEAYLKIGNKDLALKEYEKLKTLDEELAK